MTNIKWAWKTIQMDRIKIDKRMGILFTTAYTLVMLIVAVTFTVLDMLSNATFFLVAGGVGALGLMIIIMVSLLEKEDRLIQEGFERYKEALCLPKGQRQRMMPSLEGFELRMHSFLDILVSIIWLILSFATAVYLSWKNYMAMGNIILMTETFGVTLAALLCIFHLYENCKIRRKISQITNLK